MSILNEESVESFADGFSSAIDLYPQLDMKYNAFVFETFNPLYMTDAEALNSDWAKIGMDLQNAIVKYEESIRN